MLLVDLKQVGFATEIALIAEFKRAIVKARGLMPNLECWLLHSRVIALSEEYSGVVLKGPDSSPVDFVETPSLLQTHFNCLHPCCSGRLYFGSENTFNVKLYSQ